MTGREYDPEGIRTVGGKVGGMNSGLTSTGDGIKGITGDAPLGKLPSSGAASSALSKFSTALRAEFTAGAKQATATEKSLTDAAGTMDADEDTTARTFRGRE